MEQTPTQALATMKLGRDVVEWAVERRRSAQPAPSFRSIATQLRTETGIDVTDETVRLWCLSVCEHPECTKRGRVTFHNSDPCPYVDEQAAS